MKVTLEKVAPSPTPVQYVFTVTLDEADALLIEQEFWAISDKFDGFASKHVPITFRMLHGMHVHTLQETDA